MQNPQRYYGRFGAIALPGKKPGCVLVVAMDGSRDVYLLDEFEDWDCRKLVQKCFHFDEIHGPKKWVGDGEHGALKRVLREMNLGRARRIYLRTPRIIRDAYEQPYLFMLPEIKSLRDSERRQLYLGDDSLVLRYMAEISPEEMVELSLGAFPAIEALTFAVIGAREYQEFVPSAADLGETSLYGFIDEDRDADLGQTGLMDV